MMESLTIEILNPKVKKLLQSLADLNLIIIIHLRMMTINGILYWKSKQQDVFDAVESIESGKGLPHEEVIARFKRN